MKTKTLGISILALAMLTACGNEVGNLTPLAINGGFADTGDEELDTGEEDEEEEDEDEDEDEDCEDEESEDDCEDEDEDEEDEDEDEDTGEY